MKSVTYVVCHIGGGISVSAHQKGKMIDGFDIVGGEGPMAPTRCGSVAVADVLKYCEDKEIKTVKQLCTKNRRICQSYGNFRCTGTDKMCSRWR